MAILLDIGIGLGRQVQVRVRTALNVVVVEGRAAEARQQGPLSREGMLL